MRHDDDEDDEDDDDDEVDDEPKKVDKLLSKELLKLSFKDRNDYQEEIHGVKCLAPDENPELIERSLYYLAIEINNAITIPVSEKNAYLRAVQELEPITRQRSYVHSKEFRLRFLRCEMWNPKSAALRIIKFLNLALDLFGEAALWRPITLSDFTSVERRDLRKARYQLLPQRASGTGRLVFCIIPDESLIQIPSATRNKIMMYIIWVIGSDVDAQRKGFVIVCWFDSLSFSKIVSNGLKKLQGSFQLRHGSGPNAVSNLNLLSLRISAIHLCIPRNALYFYKIMRSIITLKIGSHNILLYFKFHLGTSIELRYILQGYGIATDHIPMTYTGTVKDVYWRQWMRSRIMIEENERNNTNLDMINAEAPYLTDILFKAGHPFTNHPGNIYLINLIQAKVTQQYKVNNNSTTTNTNTKQSMKTKTLISDIIDDIQHTNKVRVLNWNTKSKDNYGRWEHLLSSNSKDQKLIFSKIEWLFRVHRKSYTKKKETSQNNRKERCDNMNSASDVPLLQVTSSTSTFVSPPCARISDRRSTTIDQNGGTFLFQKQDGSGSGNCSSCCKSSNNNTTTTKKEHHQQGRLNELSLHQRDHDRNNYDNNNNHYSSDFFGMKFNTL